MRATAGSNITYYISSMKNYSPVLIAITLLAGVWLLYYINFGGGLSSDPGDWGVFGDYTGGVLNPLLNFITIYLLIKSLVFQKDQLDQARDDLDTARKNDALRAFENSLFTFSRIALDEYSSFRPIISGVTHHEAGAAVSTIQELLFAGEATRKEFEEKFNALDEQTHNAIYSLTRSFCALFKLTKETCPEEEQGRYIDMISLMIPTKAQYLLVMAEAYTSWGMLEHPRNLGFFERKAVKEMLEAFNGMVTQENEPAESGPAG